MQRSVRYVTEDTWRFSKSIEVRDLTFGVLSEVSSHLNFAEKSGGVDVGRVAYGLVDRPVNEPMQAFAVSNTQGRLCWNWTKLCLEVTKLHFHDLSSPDSFQDRRLYGWGIKDIKPMAEVLCEVFFSHVIL